MSYSIVYNRQFLKAGEKIIPLVVIGCNNLWETNYYGKSQRRVRSWNPLMNGRNAIPLMTAEEIMEKAQSWTGGEYQEHFKWHSKWVDDQALLSFCKNGIKGAASLEELKERSRYPAEVYLRCHLNIWHLKDGENRERDTSELHRAIHTTESLLDYMEEVSERLAKRQPNESTIYVCIEFYHEKAVPFPKEEAKCRKRPERLTSDYWVVVIKRTYGDSCYVKKLSSRHMWYAHAPDFAKQFKTQASAEKWVKDRNIKNRFNNIKAFEFQHVS